MNLSSSIKYSREWNKILVNDRNRMSEATVPAPTRGFHIHSKDYIDAYLGGRMRFLPENSDLILVVCWKHDFRHLVFLWSSVGRKTIWEIDIERESNSGNEVLALDVSWTAGETNEGGVLAFTPGSDKLYFVDVETGASLFGGPTDYGTVVATTKFSESGSRIAIGLRNGIVLIQKFSRKVAPETEYKMMMATGTTIGTVNFIYHDRVLLTTDRSGEISWWELGMDGVFDHDSPSAPNPSSMFLLIMQSLVDDAPLFLSKGCILAPSRTLSTILEGTVMDHVEYSHYDSGRHLLYGVNHDASPTSFGNVIITNPENGDAMRSVSVGRHQGTKSRRISDDLYLRYEPVPDTLSVLDLHTREMVDVISNNCGYSCLDISNDGSKICIFSKITRFLIILHRRKGGRESLVEFPLPEGNDMMSTSISLDGKMVIVSHMERIRWLETMSE